MTGFGRGIARVDAIEATVEVRSVNGRFAEVSVRSPRELNPFDSTIQAACKEKLARGNITVNVSIQQSGGIGGQRVDSDRVEALMGLLTEVQSAAGLSGNAISIEHLLRYPDIFTTEVSEPDQTESVLWAVVESALANALADLDQMRKQEGAALEADLTERILAIETLLQDVESRAPLRVEEAHAKLRSRLEELLSDERLNPERLETEIALIADKLDVTEECVRLRSHISQFRDALAENEAVGRRLNFIAQEFNREINTIASKANDGEVAQLTVRMKEELEKVREQVQNVV